MPNQLALIMPVYIYDGIECMSAGIVFYRRTNKVIELLFLEKQDKKNQILLEDPGGKSQADDDCIEMTAAREAAEELNAQIQETIVDSLTYQEKIAASRDYILKLIRMQKWCVLHPGTKYAIFICEMPDACVDLDFGTRELHPKFQIDRVAKWIPVHEIQKRDIKTLHPRIRHLVKFL